jgi:hypothetical protein
MTNDLFQLVISTVNTIGRLTKAIIISQKLRKRIIAYNEFALLYWRRENKGASSIFEHTKF